MWGLMCTPKDMEDLDRTRGSGHGVTDLRKRYKPMCWCLTEEEHVVTQKEKDRLSLLFPRGFCITYLTKSGLLRIMLCSVILMGKIRRCSCLRQDLFDSSQKARGHLPWYF